MRSNEAPGRAWLILGALTASAVVLRVVALDAGLWVDEISTVLDFVRKPLLEIVTVYGRNDHPLNSLLAHAAVAVFGEHAWSLRLPAMLFGVACIPLVYVLGTRIASAREGLLAAALLTVSYHHIWFSQNARGYTALAFWAMLSSVLLIDGRRSGRPLMFAAYGVAAALGTYTHLAMVFVVLAHLLGCVWDQIFAAGSSTQRNWKLPAIGFAVAGLIAALLYAPMLAQLSGSASAPSALQQVATPRWAMREMWHALLTGFGALGTIVSVLLVALGFRELRRSPWIVVTLVALPAVLTGAALVAFNQPIHPRFLFFMIGFGALIVARGATVVGAWFRRPAAGTWLVAAAMLANVLSLGDLYRLPKQDYAGAMRYIDQRADAGDAVMLAGITGRAYREYYGRPWPMVSAPDEVRRVRSASRQAWLVYSMPQYMNPALVAWLDEECRSTEVFAGTLSGGDVMVCALAR